MRFGRVLPLIIIMILAFTFASPLHITAPDKNITLPYYVTGDKKTTDVTNLSDGNVNIATSSCTPSYYVENETAFNNTEYTFNVTGYLSSQNNGGTGNNIMLMQDGKTLMSISYGRLYNDVTTVSGSKNYKGILNFSQCYVQYNLHMVFSSGMKNHALVWSGKSPAIPPIVTLKNPYSVNNVSFMFGGKYSNQTIGHISITHYRKLVFSNQKSTYTFRHEESYRLNPSPVDENNTVYTDRDLNSLIYVSSMGSIERYNYYNSTYSLIARISPDFNGNLSSLHYGNHYIYYTWNSTVTSIYSINGTNMSVHHESFENHNMAHMLFFNGSYVFYNLHGDIMFANGNIVNLGNLKILQVNASRNINIIALNSTGIENYTVTPNGTVSNNGYNEMRGKYNVTYFYKNNGISSYFREGNISMAINGELYYRFFFIANGIGSSNGMLFKVSNGTNENLGIKMDGYLSPMNNTLIMAVGNNIDLYSEYSILSPYTVTISSIRERVEFNNTILFLNVNSSLNYNITARTLNKTYSAIDNNTFNLTFTGIKSGNYTVNFIVTNSAGYSYMENYTFTYNNTISSSHKSNAGIQSIKIMNSGGSFFVVIKGNQTRNATIAWYVNGKYSNSGKVLNSKLGIGINSISVKVTENGKVYTATRKVTYFGNIPYYVGIAGISTVLFIFLANILYFNNKNVDDLIRELNGENLRQIIKSGRKERIGRKTITSRIRMLSMAGKISIERDMDNNKFIIASKSFLKEKNTFHDSHEN